jgi:AcrR family transcriptional regulator
VDSRSRILGSALDAFAERGLIGASIGEISRTAPASVGSIYHHFEGKEGLAAAVYVACLADFQRAFARALEQADTGEDGIRAGVHATLRWCLRDNPGGARFLLTASDAARGAAHDELERLNGDFFRQVRRWWRAHDDLKDLDFDTTHAIWLGPALEYCRLRLGGRTRVPLTRAERELADAAWLALGTQGADR